MIREAVVNGRCALPTGWLCSINCSIHENKICFPARVHMNNLKTIRMELKSLCQIIRLANYEPFTHHSASINNEKDKGYMGT